MIEIRQNPIEWFIKAFSVLSGGAFIVSGLFNGLIFRSMWQVNYFQIATPADVIMSAFLFATMAGVGIGIGYLWHRFLDPLLTRLFDLFLLPLIEAMLPKSQRGKPRVPPKPFDRFLTYLFTSLFFTVGLCSWGVRDGKPLWFSSGLAVEQGLQIGGKDCGGGRVRWLGSTAAVIDCPNGRTVILHKLDDLRTVPVRPWSGAQGFVEPQPPVTEPSTRENPRPPSAPVQTASPQASVPETVPTPAAQPVLQAPR